MGSFAEFTQYMDWWGLLTLLVSAVAALLCITLHELSHGFVAWRLGDPTAKQAGRLTLNPIKHLDLAGLAMMLIAKVVGPSRCRWICGILSTLSREWP